MLLLQLKKASRLVFRNMQARIDDIENEIKRADSILVNVHRMESETTSLHKKLSYYQSYKYKYFIMIMIELPRWIKYLFLLSKQTRAILQLYLKRSVKDCKKS